MATTAIVRTKLLTGGLTRIVGRRVRASILEALRPSIQALFDPYRPERHYMRGPGPKWREKHGLVRRQGR
jgi:hypothetical protein